MGAQGALVTPPSCAARATPPRMYAAFAKEPVAAVGPDGMPSFVQTEMRGAAMALHTKDQSKEGKQPAQKPVNAWEPGQADYLQFLVDSRHVYSTLEELVDKYDALAQYRNSGLERAEALEMDIQWFKEQGHTEPAVGQQGTTYAALLRELAAASNVPYHWQIFTCHFYNFYFAHTAGGRMIGEHLGLLIRPPKPSPIAHTVARGRAAALDGSLPLLASAVVRERGNLIVSPLHASSHSHFADSLRF